MSVTKRLRFEILSRDGFACVYCGADSTQLHVDHVIPQALGGTDDPSNLATACADCNAGKASTSPSAASVAAVDSKDLEWRANVADALAQIAAVPPLFSQSVTICTPPMAPMASVISRL